MTLLHKPEGRMLIAMLVVSLGPIIGIVAALSN
jgi:hypothetical protein